MPVHPVESRTGGENLPLRSGGGAVDARAWWAKRRLVYNGVLVTAGMASLTVYAGLLELSKCEISEQDLTPMTLIYQALVYLGAMGVANLAWSLAPLAERRLRPARVEQFRRWAFWLGLGISFALPFLPPLVHLARCR